jgi:catechol 2,3-dioxygenase-like lactoylglutathione lyase family enzyme
VGGESPFERAIPVLPSLDVARTVAFYEGVLGFVRRHLDADYAILVRDAVEIHFWRCTDPRLAEASGCRIGVTAIAPLYEAMRGKGVVHPNAALAVKPWGLREFAIVDGDGNLITFFERAPGS